MAVGLGLVLGFVLGVTSVGSGALIGLALILFFRLTPHRVVGTDVFHAAVLLWAAGLAHVVAGNVDYGLMLNILFGSVGRCRARRAARPQRARRRAAAGARLRDARLGARGRVQGGARPAGYAIVGPPLLALALAYWLSRSRSARARASAT